MEPIGWFVGAGHAPPATKRQREPNGKTGTGEQCSPLQEPIGLRAGWGEMSGKHPLISHLR